MRGWPVVALAWAGPVAVAAAWAAVVIRRVSVWAAMSLTLIPLGALSLATRELSASPEVAAWLAAAAGVAAGMALYAATAVFMARARGWSLLAGQARELYGRVQGLTIPAALGAAVIAVATGEELLWRGIVQGALAERIGDVSGAAVAWVVYVVANAVSVSLPIVLGTVVAGATWGALALWTGGVLASVLCHVTWTGLMIFRPPIDAGGDPTP